MSTTSIFFRCDQQQVFEVLYFLFEAERTEEVWRCSHQSSGSLQREGRDEEQSLGKQNRTKKCLHHRFHLVKQRPKCIDLCLVGKNTSLRSRESRNINLLLIVAWWPIDRPHNNSGQVLLPQGDGVACYYSMQTESEKIEIPFVLLFLFHRVRNTSRGADTRSLLSVEKKKSHKKKMERAGGYFHSSLSI